MTEDLAPDAIRRGPFHPPRISALALIVPAFLAIMIGITLLMQRFSLPVSLAAGVCVAFSFLAFIRVPWVLYVLVLASLFSPELAIAKVLGPVAKRPLTFRVEDVLLAVITFSWLARSAVSKELGLLLRTPLNKPIFFYALVCVVSTALGYILGWVTSPASAALFVVKYIEYFVLFFMVVNHIETPRELRNLVIAAVLTYLIVCAYGFAQIPSGERPTTYAQQSGEPNTLAGYLLLMIGLCAGLLLYARTFATRLFWGLLTLLGFILLAYTLSRSGWLGIVGIVLVLVLIGRHKLALLGTLAGLIALLALTSFDIRWLPNPIEQRIRETVGQFEPTPGPPPLVLFGITFDPSASERLRSYGKALSIWFDRCEHDWVPALTGSGVLGGTKFVDGQYVRVLVETGLLGLTAFLVLIAVIWRHVWRSYKKLQTPWYKGLTLGYLAGFAGLLLHAVGANTFIIVRIMEPFFIFTGVVMLLPAIEERAAREAGRALEPQ